MNLIVRGKPRPPFVADMLFAVLGVLFWTGRVVGSVMAGFVVSLLFLDYLPRMLRRAEELGAEPMGTVTFAVLLFGTVVGCCGISWAVWCVSAPVSDWPDRCMPKKWVRPEPPAGQDRRVKVTWRQLWASMTPALRVWGVGVVVLVLASWVETTFNWYPASHWYVRVAVICYGLTFFVAVLRRYEEVYPEGDDHAT